MRIFLFLVAALASVPANLAFAPAKSHGTAFSLTRTSQAPPRSLTVVSSAKVLPFAYTSASAALLFKATKAATKAEKAVLLATSALSFINFGPSDNAKLASAKKAYKKTDPASSGRAKSERQAALTWRSVIRIKIIGQVLGLIWMSCAKNIIGTMRGAAVVMAANMMFFISGAGNSRHDDLGNWKPMPSNLSTMGLVIDTILCNAALVAARSPVESTKFAIAAGIFSFGALVGALEGLPNFLKALDSLRRA